MSGAGTNHTRMNSTDIFSKIRNVLTGDYLRSDTSMLKKIGTLRFDLKLSHKALILVSVPLIFEIIFVLALAIMLNQAEREMSREVQARTIIYHVSRININLMEAGGSVAGYSISKSSRFHQVFQEAVQAITGDLRSLGQLRTTSPSQYIAYRKYYNLVDNLIKVGMVAKRE